MYRTATAPLLKKPSGAAPKGRKTEALLAAGLLVSFFLPWIYSMGTPLRIHQIRERLSGPHRLLSAFSSGSRVSSDYRLSLYLYAIPIAAGLLLLLIGFRKYRPWIGFAVGGLAVGAFWFLRAEVAAFPFHRMAVGSYVALASGIGLGAATVIRSLRT